MKNIVLILCSILTLSVSAQKSITITGEFKEDFITKEPSKQLRKTLFVLEKGDIYFPEGMLFDRMYFLKLSTKDAKKLGAKVILIYPFFDREITFIYNTPITLELLPIPNLPDCYYSKKASCDQKSSTYPQNLPLSTMNKIKQVEVFSVENFERNDYDFRDLPEWIEALDNDKKVPITRTRRLYLTDDTERTEEELDMIALSDLAKMKMKSVKYFFGDIVPLAENPTKKDWQQWWKKLMLIKLPYEHPKSAKK